MRIFLLLSLLALSGCSGRSSELQPGREIASATAPDGGSRAFLWEPKETGGLGATTSQIYQIWVQRLPEKQERELMLEVDKTSGIKLYWAASGKLELCYEKAQILAFHNLFDAIKENPPGVYEVEVILKRVDMLNACQTATR